MVKLVNLLSRLNPAKVLVVGDMLLDTYTIGKAHRISPEAPVAIVHVQKEECHPGGSGNVILNLLSLGAQVVALGRLGKDEAGYTFIQALEKEGVNTSHIVWQEKYPTPVKNRIIAENQQIVRIDHEQIIQLHSLLEQQIIINLPSLLEGIKVIAISDYGKGFLTNVLLSALIQEAQKREIPVITDPKGNDFSKYKGTTIIKPNLSEAYGAAHLPVQTSLESVAARVLHQTHSHLLMITRSEAGISLFDSLGARYDFPAHVKEIKDVTGAGDTVLAMLTYAVANQLSYEEAAQLCNVAAGIAIEHVGCARVSLSDLAHRLLELDMSHKVFDRDHLFVLQEVLKCKPFNVLLLSQVNQLTEALFQSIKQLTQEKEDLLIYVDDEMLGETFIEMLASLREVTFIAVHLDSLKSLCVCATPKQTYMFEGSKNQLINVNCFSYLSQCQVLDPISNLNLETDS